MSQSNVSASRNRTHKLTVTAMLSAVAFILMFIEFPIPALIPSFVKMDVSDLPELLAAFSLGPVYGVAVTFLKNLLHIVFKGTSSAYVGELCNFLLGAVFSLAAGFIYQRKKSRKSALIGAVIGAALMAIVSVPLNYFVVYPAYVVCYGMPLEAIIGMYQAILPSSDSLIKCLTIFNMPFTFCKGMLDVLLCFLIYKPLSPLLHK
ncbi:ECF transporter S component [Dysosmobacter sp.]|uniref:ECF transporter S component n=1 Tax=Dysosmobacter sp. TaxID=2591382 RepID=UPI002A9214CE|nr:ECF transporter S component [Dysosmobacter sp.]MDY5613597.1 ECF transporter S component [Dysosmobacter sp.]